MKTLVLATRNRDKVREITQTLRLPPAVQTLCMRDFQDVPDTIEDGKTLEDNARKKALEAAKATGCVALADDTGLEIKALNGEPGVFAARYAGPNCSYLDNCRKVLDLMKETPANNRAARFRTVLCLTFPDGKTEFFEGVLEGTITTASLGKNGFGYDPIFAVPPHGKTLAELSAKEKNAISHRGKALAAIRPRLLKLFA